MNDTCMAGLSSVLAALAISSAAAEEAPRPDLDLAKLRASIEREAAVAEGEGYVPHLTRHLLKSAEGQAADRARSVLLRAKGALLDLKLPRWAKELRYYRQRELETAGPVRGPRWPSKSSAGAASVSAPT